MNAHVDSVCKLICQNNLWKLNNLRLQKILYLAEMVHIGENHGHGLSDARFESWDVGPIEPSIHRKLTMFGIKPIPDVFYRARKFKDGDPRKMTISRVCKQTREMSDSQLVGLTHWESGAWARRYVPGVNGLSISDEDVLAEYFQRWPADIREKETIS